MDAGIFYIGVIYSYFSLRQLSSYSSTTQTL